MKNSKSAIRTVLLILLALAAGICVGFFVGHSQIETDLRLTVTVDEEASFKEFTEENLGGNFNKLTYFELSDVSIQIGRKTMKLEEAVRDGLVSVEQVVAQAKEDARNNECFMKYDNILGLSTFRYVYPNQYDIRVIYDVFECSDGTQYHLNDFMITAPGRSANLSPNLRAVEVRDNGEEMNLLYEDWGLEFTVAEVSPTSIILNYTQSGGMVTGDLSMKWIHIFDADHYMLEEKTEWSLDPIPMQLNTSTGALTLNWEQMYGELPPGDYTLYLYIYDTYNESDVHPLIQNYCDGQYFPIVFTIS